MQSVNELCEKGNSLSESTIWYGYCKIIYYPANTACYLEELCYGSGEDGNYCTYQCCNFI